MEKKFYIIKKQNPREILAMAIGVFLGIGGIALLSHLTGNVFIMAPFGASAVLLYCAKSSPLAQPRNFLASHFIVATIGITCVRLFGSEWYVTAISVSLAILAMMLTDTVHASDKYPLTACEICEKSDCEQADPRKQKYLVK